MSWDIFVQDLPPDARTIRDIPDHFKPSPLGARSALIQQIRGLAPSANFTDPSWGRLETPSFSVEFSLGNEELVRSCALHIRGDDSAAAFVADLLTHLGYRALDPQSDSGLFEPGRVAEASMRRWREYRDRVVH
jgi:hypothetical protein